MSLSKIFQVAAQGMTAQRERLEAATANLANSNSTRTAAGGPYRRRDVVFEALAVDSTTSPLDSSLSASFSLLFRSGFVDGEPMEGVRATTIAANPNESIIRFQPDHPDADPQGYVRMPDVDPLEETVNMLSAARSFEANATAFSTAKELMRATLKLSEV